MDNTTYKDLRKDMSKIEKDIIALHKDISKMSEQVDKIQLSLVGDDKFGQEGLVKMVKRHEKWVENQRYMYAKICGGAVVISALTTLVIKFWNSLF
jgi:predicted  nucleic acid-binding Zn-ribbon protein